MVFACLLHDSALSMPMRYVRVITTLNLWKIFDHLQSQNHSTNQRKIFSHFIASARSPNVSTGYTVAPLTCTTELYIASPCPFFASIIVTIVSFLIYAFKSNDQSQNHNYALWRKRCDVTQGRGSLEVLLIERWSIRNKNMSYNLGQLNCSSP